MAAFGAPTEMTERWRGRSRKGFVVMRRNWDAVRLFAVVQTQWQRAGAAGVSIGLSYPGVEAAARMAAIAVSPATFDGLQIMEAEALRVFAKRRPS
jgi:hypothetical protein